LYATLSMRIGVPSVIWKRSRAEVESSIVISFPTFTEAKPALR
jgi:hypothetical protein